MLSERTTASLELAVEDVPEGVHMGNLLARAVQYKDRSKLDKAVEMLRDGLSLAPAGPFPAPGREVLPLFGSPAWSRRSGFFHTRAVPGSD